MLEVRVKSLPPLLQTLVGEPAMRASAIRGLAIFDDAKTPTVVLTTYPNLSAAKKRDAITALASRAAFAKELLAAVATKTVPATDIPAVVIRQLRNLNDDAVTKQIAAAWSLVRESPAERKQLITDWSKKLTPNLLATKKASGTSTRSRPWGRT